jgi:excisionase family DNA binding protein
MAALTLEEAAASLGVAASTLRVQMRNGKLRGTKVGPVWTVTPKEVERYRKESRRTPPLSDHGK